MSKELELWRFVASHLQSDEDVAMLVVATSQGSSPGRAGYKMAVTADGALCGSIGGGVMEVRLVDQTKEILAEKGAMGEWFSLATVHEQVHQKNAANFSGMICSGRQTVIFKLLTLTDSDTVNLIVEALHQRMPLTLEISNLQFQTVENPTPNSRRYFYKTTDTEFVYQERLGSANKIYIVGGGHCALALSELISRLDFAIQIFDDRPDLNTIAKNQFADEITILDGYDKIARHIPNGENVYVVVMTLGYKSDAAVIRQLIDHEFRYFGVLGSTAKMATLMKELRSEGFDAAKLGRIRTPIGLPINSRTPAEIAISIAAEIIAVKNANEPQNRSL